MRCRGGVGGPSGKLEIHARIGERLRVIYLGERSRMPADGNVDIIESASTRHERLRRPTFFRRATVIAYTSLLAGLFQPVLNRRRSQNGGGTQKIVAATMAMSRARDRTGFRNTRFLAEARKGIVFTQDCDDRSTISGFTHHGGGNARYVLGNTEPLFLQHCSMLGTGLIFGISDLRHAPDAVTQGFKISLLRVHQIPDIFTILHGVLSQQCS